jgi:hypothetical protein
LLSSEQEFDEKFLDSKHVLKVYFKPSRKNQNFGFLPLSSKLVRLTNPYLMPKVPYSYEVNGKLVKRVLKELSELSDWSQEMVP